MLKNPSYSGITTEFWNSMDAICSRDQWTLWGTPNCGKGQPQQVMGTGHGASPARLRISGRTRLSLPCSTLPGRLSACSWSIRRRADAQASMRGVNAAVVGLLGAALYNPVWTSSVHTPGDVGIALVGFVLLTVWRAPPLVVVVISALSGIAIAQVVS